MTRYITGMFTTIHPIEPVSVQPFSVMTNWRVFQLRGPTGRRSRHLVGRAGGEGRVCSALASLDLLTLTAISGSGRFYRLPGPPGHDPDAQYVLDTGYRGHARKGRYARAAPTSLHAAPAGIRARSA